MKNIEMKNIEMFILGLFGIVGLVFFLNGLGLVSFKFFEPKMENARREVFENTQSFVHGKIQEISKYRVEYELSKDERDKQALRAAILRCASDVDLSKLPQTLKRLSGESGDEIVVENPPVCVHTVVFQKIL